MDILSNPRTKALGCILSFRQKKNKCLFVERPNVNIRLSSNNEDKKESLIQIRVAI